MVEGVGSEDEDEGRGGEDLAIASMKKWKDKREEAWDDLDKKVKRLYELFLQMKMIQNQIKQKRNRLDGGVTGAARRAAVEGDLKLLIVDFNKKESNFNTTKGQTIALAKQIRNKRTGGEAVSAAGSDDEDPLADKLVRIPMKGLGRIKYRTSPWNADIEELKYIIPRGGRRKTRKRKRRRKKKTKRKKKEKKKKKKNSKKKRW